MDATKNLIKAYCVENDMNISAFEAKAGLSRDVIYSFLNGKVSDLKLSNAIKIASTIGCSLDELAGTKVKPVLYSTDTDLNKDLLKSALSFVLNYIEQRSIKNVSLAETFSVVDAIYDYSCKNSKNSIDTAFGNWFCGNAFHK